MIYVLLLFSSMEYVDIIFNERYYDIIIYCGISIQIIWLFNPFRTQKYIFVTSSKSVNSEIKTINHNMRFNVVKHTNLVQQKEFYAINCRFIKWYNFDIFLIWHNSYKIRMVFT